MPEGGRRGDADAAKQVFGATPPEKAGPRRPNGRGPASRLPEIRDPSL